MPDVAVHYYFGGEVYARLEEDIRRRIDKPLFELALNGPDDWAMFRFWCPPARRGINRRSSVMHYEKTGEFLLALAESTRQSPKRDELFSYLAGYLCHYALDAGTHPFIVARCGIYDGTKATKRFRGRHMLYEHALDLWALKKRGLSLKERPISRTMFALRRLPKSLREPLDELYARVYGWENCGELLNRCRRDIRWIYYLLEDPHGLLYGALSLLRPIRPDLRALSYYKTGYEGMDIANESHAPWQHPHDAAIRSTASFEELTERACTEALGCIRAARRYADGEIGREELAAVVGNRSYVSGWDPDDARAKAPAQLSLLPLTPEDVCISAGKVV